MQLYPFLFQPNLHSLVWGGNQLRPYKGLEPNNEPIGESWEVSTIPSSVSVITNGIFSGRNLTSVIREYPVEILGIHVNEKYGAQLPLLVKYIDAKQDLSIQVHPNDDMAFSEHGKRGKNEMWYVVKADQGSCLYSGFKYVITPEDYKKRVSDGTITEVLAKHEVKPGDVFYIPAGRIHSICGGILLAEIQQSSDVTYRIYDYNRPGLDGKPRELHTELASKAIDYTVYPNYRVEYNKEMNKAVDMLKTDYFNVQLLSITKEINRDMRRHDSLVITMCLEGDCIIRINSTGEVTILKQGSSRL